MKSKWENMCEEHMGEMAFWRTVMGFASLLLTSLITLKVFEVI